MRRSSMTLFSDPTCQYSHRVRIVLAEKGVTVEIEDTDPKFGDRRNTRGQPVRHSSNVWLIVILRSMSLR